MKEPRRPGISFSSVAVATFGRLISTFAKPFPPFVRLFPAPTCVARRSPNNRNDPITHEYSPTFCVGDSRGACRYPLTFGFCAGRIGRSARRLELQRPRRYLCLVGHRRV